MNLWWNKPLHSSTIVVTPPASEPVSLALAKKQCRIEADYTDEDDLIARLITAARLYCEARISRAFVTQTVKLSLDAFPFHRAWSPVGAALTLSKPPIQSVSWVKYIDPSGTLQTLDPSFYTVDASSQPARIVRNQLNPWPTTGFYPAAVQIQFVAGYGNADAVPANIGQAILLLTGHYYRVREAVGNYGAEVPLAVESLLMASSWGMYA